MARPSRKARFVQSDTVFKAEALFRHEQHARRRRNQVFFLWADRSRGHVDGGGPGGLHL